MIKISLILIKRSNFWRRQFFQDAKMETLVLKIPEKERDKNQEASVGRERPKLIERRMEKYTLVFNCSLISAGEKNVMEFCNGRQVSVYFLFYETPAH